MINKSPISKKCPFCSEEINKNAVKCRFCNEWLNKKQFSQYLPIIGFTIFLLLIFFVGGVITNGNNISKTIYNFRSIFGGSISISPTPSPEIIPTDITEPTTEPTMKPKIIYKQQTNPTAIPTTQERKKVQVTLNNQYVKGTYYCYEDSANYLVGLDNQINVAYAQSSNCSLTAKSDEDFKKCGDIGANAVNKLISEKNKYCP